MTLVLYLRHLIRQILFLWSHLNDIALLLYFLILSLGTVLCLTFLDLSTLRITFTLISFFPQRSRIMTLWHLGICHSFHSLSYLSRTYVICFSLWWLTPIILFFCSKRSSSIF